MKTSEENGSLIIFLAGRIDSTNAAAFEQELTDAVSAHAGMEPVLDAGELQYISSAGLRVLMRLRKARGEDINVRNVSPEVFEIFDVTGFTSFLKVEKAMRDRAKELLDIFGLLEERNNLACNLPYGKQRKLEIARALATNPKLLLLDEPAAGMNPQETAELMDTIRFVRDHFDMTILLIEHDMSLVAGICEEITVLNFGQTLAHGSAEEVLHDPEVIRAYLGDD